MQHETPPISPKKTEESQAIPAESPPPTPLKKQNRHHPKQQPKNSFWSTVFVIVSALVLAFMLVTYVFHSYQVDGVSMETTLQNNDRLIVWKVPRTIARVTGNPYIPNRGDVIVFTESGLSGYGQIQDKKQLIKRVIALPGERVVIRDGKLLVYNAQHPEGFEPDRTLPYGANIGVTNKGINGDSEFEVKEGQVFVAGDNREESLDSRAFGPIDANNIIGKLIVRILPLDQITKF
ncbi:MAG: signal peptidase I [Candidatus Saccharimonadales bacterium]